MPQINSDVQKQVKTFRFEKACGGKGFYYEADSIALDIAAGRKQSEIMPLDETLRAMRLIDEARAKGGAKFPQDDD
ncbi:hypothetical protein N7520_002310 [Penicillium odoratum]|uniref:uncharacterized protein n=1 Tax=Penicillium odoratum TaxID=1167516 RepID=UPI002547395E|nr:uncharacterized protein N7520_002310 [Penicillium odoratum]KAJ5771781.1 hypothetical protein N7520_002310 [Penicillium odoratum]